MCGFASSATTESCFRCALGLSLGGNHWVDIMGQDCGDGVRNELGSPKNGIKGDGGRSGEVSILPARRGATMSVEIYERLR
jgi:hypothetical protein